MTVLRQTAPCFRISETGEMMSSYTDSSELKGVGGWLGLFVVILAIISPVRIVIETYNILQTDPAIAPQLGIRWQIYKIFTWSLSLATIVAMLYFAYRLVRIHNRSTVPLVIKGLWFVAIVPIVLDFIVAAILWPDGIVEGLDATYFVPIFQSLVFSTIWSLYLAKSRRVANTYVDDHTDAARIFG